MYDYLLKSYMIVYSFYNNTTVSCVCFMVDIIPCDDAVPARCRRVTDSEDQPPCEGHPEHHAYHLTLLVVWQITLC